MKAALYAGWAFPPETLFPLAREAGLTPADPAAAELWIGWSLGGLRVLREATERDTSPRGLVLIASGARFCADGRGWPGVPEANLRAFRRQFARDPETALGNFHRWVAGDSLAPEVVAARCRQGRPFAAPSGLVELATLDLRAAASRLRAPILLLHGACDRVFPPAVARATAALLQQPTLHIHASAGHDLPLLETGWCARHIQAWMATW